MAMGKWGEHWDGPGRNPVAVREMRGRWRRPATQLIMLGYAIALSLAMIYAYDASRGGGVALTGRTGVKVFGHQLFGAFLGVETALWMVLATALTATGISFERENGLLQGVLLTPVTAGQFVRGKLTAALWFIFLMLLVPMPIVSLCFTLGGLSPWEFIVSFALLAGTALAGACLGLATSACHKRSDAALLTALVVALSLGWPPVLVAFGFDGEFFVMGALLCVVYQLVLALAGLGVATDAVAAIFPEREVDDTPLLHDQWVRPETARPSSVAASIPTASHWEELPGIGILRFKNPVMQREIRARFRRRIIPVDSPNGRQYLATTGPTDWVIFAAIAVMTTALPAMLGGLGPLLIGFGLLFVTLCASTLGALSITREREQKTLTPLLLSMLTPQDVLVGKLGAVLFLTAIYSLPLAPVVAVSAFRGDENFLDLTLIALSLVWCASAIGMTLSNLFKNPAVAVASAAATSMMLTVGAAVYQRHLVLVSMLFFAAGLLLFAILRWNLRPQSLEKDGENIWRRDLTKGR